MVVTGERRRGRPRKDAKLAQNSTEDKELQMNDPLTAADEQPAQDIAQEHAERAKMNLLLRSAPESILQQRTARNPRENPTDGTDLSFD